MAEVPVFGNWDTDHQVPFTKVFDNARANRGKMFNPNDPMENPEAFGLDPYQDVLGNRRKPPATSKAPKPRREQEPPVKRSNADLPPYATQRDAPNQQSRPAVNSSSPLDPLSRRVQDISRGSSAPGSVDNSPRVADRAQGKNRSSAASPAGLDRKSSSNAGGTTFSPGTPQRSRQQSISSLSTKEIDKAPTLPKFGDWNINDPSAGQGFTMIFDNARTEKKAGGVPQVPSLQAAHTPERNPVRSRSDPPKSAKNRWLCCISSEE